MAHQKRKHNHKKKHRQQAAAPQLYLLDQFSVADVVRWNAIRDKLLKFCWDFHWELEYQRSVIREELYAALVRAGKPLGFKGWQRCVSYKHALQPLSAKGSTSDIGGRFNIGKIQPAFQPFPALYLAEDKRTALSERLAQNLDKSKEKLNPWEFALRKEKSIAIVSVNGELESVIDLNTPESLKDFVNLIKDFKISPSLSQAAMTFKPPPLALVRTLQELQRALLGNFWMINPQQFDVPAASQIFGELVQGAGIQGIVYPSKFTGSNCLAIFPRNFQDSTSYVELNEVASDETISRLDSETFADLT